MAGPVVYFCCSVRGRRLDQVQYERILQMLHRYGTVYTEHMGRPEITDDDDEDYDEEENEEVERIHKGMALLRISEVVVAEVTNGSFAVGYELARAEALGKKVLCLFRAASGQVLSTKIRDSHNGRSVQVKHYDPHELEEILHEYFTISLPSL